MPVVKLGWVKFSVESSLKELSLVDQKINQTFSSQSLFLKLYSCFGKEKKLLSELAYKILLLKLWQYFYGSVEFKSVYGKEKEKSSSNLV